MSYSTTQAIQLSPLELLGCWTALELGETPGILWLPAPGETEEDSRRLLAGTVAGLAGRGLSDGRQLHPTLAGMLRVIAHSEFMVDLRLSDARGSAASILGLGAVAGAHGVTLVTKANSNATHGMVAPMELTPMDSTRVTGTLLGLAAAHGPIRPGMGVPVNISSDALDAAVKKAPANDVWAVSDRLRELGVSSRDGSSLARMCSNIALIGQLGATGRHGQFRKERRGAWMVGFHATDRGWFSQLRRGGYVSVQPVDGNGLLRQWHELINTVRRDR